jgi:hypothetical protein
MDSEFSNFSFLKQLLREKIKNKNYLFEETTVDKKNSNDKVLVIDTNLGLEHALGIAKKYETYYSIVNGEPYPHLKNEITGYGFNSIKKISDFGAALEDGVNVIFFTDSGFGALADYLRKDGYYVISADAKSEKLELDRVYVRKVLEKLGVKAPPGKVVKGIQGVVQAIKDYKGQKVFIKISRVRGDVETFGTNDPYEAEIILSKGLFRIISDGVKFVVEEELKGVEIGVDAFINKNGFVPIVAETIEVKGSGNATKFVPLKESIWHDVLKKFEPWLVKNGYVGYFCLEGFFDGKDIYVTDVTPRPGYICSYAYPKIIKNYPDFIVKLAKNEEILPEYNHKYSVQLGLYTDDTETPRVIDIDNPNKNLKWIAFRRTIFTNNRYWYVPGDPLIISSISEDDNLGNAVDKSIQTIESVSVPNSYHLGFNFKNSLFETIKKAEKLGYSF